MTVDTENPLSPPLTLHLHTRSPSLSCATSPTYALKGGEGFNVLSTPRKATIIIGEFEWYRRKANDVGREAENMQESSDVLSSNCFISLTPLMAGTTLITSNPPPPYTLINAPNKGEPSVEDLLVSSGFLEDMRAWEAGMRLGKTVKRILTAGPPHPASGAEKADYEILVSGKQ
ncbi:hypothetical protein M404DRAFT_36693 [Pisolithus tinctorius Marx 270]|uniref:Uncharacterized protein n=1 Tax=Pisolithus tinctorius Marx 270 TaxID=870435 RepID=A0A0C3NB65_PISTI|nr:hypothetical protein M404DRAFT_36693 [Pisolithus tinctorius Marx 270]